MREKNLSDRGWHQQLDLLCKSSPVQEKWKCNLLGQEAQMCRSLQNSCLFLSCYVHHVLSRLFNWSKFSTSYKPLRILINRRPQKNQRKLWLGGVVFSVTNLICEEWWRFCYWGIYGSQGNSNSDINLWFYCRQKQRDEPEFTVKAAKMHFRGKMLKFPQTKDFSERLVYWSEKKLKGVNKDCRT